MKSSTKGIIAVVSFLAVFAIVALIVTTTLSNATKTNFSTIRNEMLAGNVQKISINNDKVSVKYREGAEGYKKNKSYDAYAYARDTFMQDLFDDYEEVRQKKLAEAGNDADKIAAVEAQFPAFEKIAITFNDRNSGSIWNILYPIIGIVLIAVMAFFLFRSMGGQNKQAMNFGKSKANVQGNLKVRFTDVAGADEEKQELQEIVEFLKSPQKFTAVGARIPKGVLLVGPPGTGKTLFAKAVAGEANVPFFSISGSDFVEMFVGVGASRVRDLFDQAKKNMPCIIFIDEIDAVGRQRGAGLGGGHDEREQTLNQLLVQMDGFETNDGVIVMAATNRADILDPALLRPGRFDRQIYVNIPDVRGREAIFKVHARNKPIAPSVDFQVLARITSGFSGAEIANLLNEAAILCARDNRTQIGMEDLYEGINKVVMGPQKKSRLVTEVDKRITAYHEAGHAIVARLEPMCDPVHEVSIIPRGQAAGYTMTRPDSDDDDHRQAQSQFGHEHGRTRGRGVGDRRHHHGRGGRHKARHRHCPQDGHGVGHERTRPRVLRLQPRSVFGARLPIHAHLFRIGGHADRRRRHKTCGNGAQRGGQKTHRTPRRHGLHGALADRARNHLFRRSGHDHGRQAVRRGARRIRRPFGQEV